MTQTQKKDKKGEVNAFIILPDDKIIANYQEKPPSLELLQETVGGDIEVLHVPLTSVTSAGMLSRTKHTPKVAQLIVCEDGLLKKLPINPIASSLVGHQLVGVAVLLIEGAKIT